MPQLHNPLCDKTCQDFADHAYHRCCRVCRGVQPWPTPAEGDTPAAGMSTVDVRAIVEVVLIVLEKLELIDPVDSPEDEECLEKPS